MHPQKLASTTEVGYGLQKYNMFSERRAKKLIIFFLYFPEFFYSILVKPNNMKQSVVERG
jgi:hypothetical protein